MTNQNIDVAVKQALKLGGMAELEKLNYDVRMDYNRIGFILQALVPILDRLLEHNTSRFALKKAIKDFIRESEKMIKEHHGAYENHVEVDQDGVKIETSDIYNITAKAYDYIVDCLYYDKPNEILSKKSIVDKFLAEGGNLEDISIPFRSINQEPIRIKDLVENTKKEL